MSDLISRQAAIEAIINTGSRVAYHSTSERVLFGSAFRQNEIIDIINALPPVEPKRLKGKWMPIIEANELGEAYQAGICCSECGETLSCEANFCPNCGADMRGDKECH